VRYVDKVSAPMDITNTLHFPFADTL